MVKTSVARSGWCAISTRGVIVGVQVAALAQRVGHQRGGLGRAPERRRRAVAVDDGAAQRPASTPAPPSSPSNAMRVTG